MRMPPVYVLALSLSWLALSPVARAFGQSPPVLSPAGHPRPSTPAPRITPGNDSRWPGGKDGTGDGAELVNS